MPIDKLGKYLPCDETEGHGQGNRGRQPQQPCIDTEVYTDRGGAHDQKTVGMLRELSHGTGICGTVVR